MEPQLILLLVCLGTIDGATVTLTEAGASDVFPRPASGQFRVSVACDNNRRDMIPEFYIKRNAGSKVYWRMSQNMLRTLDSNIWHEQTLPSHDCNEGYGMIFKVEWKKKEVSVEYKGTVIRGTVGGGRWGNTWHNTWFLYLYKSGNVTATDDGYVKNWLTVKHHFMIQYLK